MNIRKVEWHMAYRKRTEKLLYEDPTDFSGFKVIKNSLRYWCADPFLVKHKGKNYVFFEMYDRLKRKGCIGYRLINEDGTLSSMKKVHEDDCHLSYPLIWCQDDDWYIIPESNAKKQLYLMKAVNFPDQWKIDKVLLEDVRLADTTFLSYQGEQYVFATPILEDNVSALSICKIEDKVIDKTKLLAPILKDKACARMAGQFIKSGGDTIRVSQNCANSYGGGLVFSKIIAISSESFEESVIATIDGKNLTIDSQQFDGIHTYNVNEDYEFIDCKTNAKFSFVEVVGYFRNLLLSHLIKK